MLLILTSLMAGAFATTMALYVTGFGSAERETGARLSRLKSGSPTDSESSMPFRNLNLRRRASVSFAGISLVSANLASEWQTQLERAGLTLTVKEFFILRLVAALVAAGITLLLLPFPFLALVTGPVAFIAVGFWVKRRIASRKRQLEGQLVELLEMLSSGLRAGFGLLQAMEASADQLAAPISIELRRTLRDTAMGASVEDALEAMNKRIDSTDVDIAVTAILIQRTVGGNLSEILGNLAHTMRERERIRGEIRTLTSQQRLTGYVIGGIPVALALYFAIMSPDYIGLLFTEPFGRLMLGAAVTFEVLGFLIIQKIVNIEV
ncbi:MAG: type II secretion system F family protein [Dehalococcoidia bacterium]